MEIVTAMRANGILYSYLKYHIQEGKTWILPTNICPEVALTFLKAGCRLRFTDIENKELGMNLDEAKQIITSNYIGGLLYNHTYGNEYTPDQELTNLRNAHPEILLIDDRCLCDPKLKFESSWADIVLFSTNSRKQVDLDCGGYCFAKKKFKLYEKCDYNERFHKDINIKLWNNSDPYKWFTIANEPWLNVSPLRIEKEQYLYKIENFKQKWYNHKREILSVYSKKIPQDMHLGFRFNNWRFQVLTPDRDEIMGEIFNNGLFASKHYCSLGNYFDNCLYPVAQHIEKNILNLFIDKNISVNNSIKLSNLFI